MQRIGLIDVDGRNFPNLALMKVSAWHKAQGDDVVWYDPLFSGHCDKVYMSKVFSFSPDFPHPIDADVVVKGGSGYCITIEDGKEVYDASRGETLPDDVEHICPDYSLYPRLTKDTAYGFLTRGCPRGCGFCIVAHKEGRQSRKVADLSEFWSGQKNIVLLDPNILACAEWKDLLQQLIDSGATVDINQGLDIRLMTEEKAAMINEIPMKEIHFAWDRYEDGGRIIPQLEMFAKSTDRWRHGHAAIVYTIVNFDTTLEQDLERIYTLRDMGYWPYVMTYDKVHSAPVYQRLARWVNNRRVFGVVKRFEDYNG